MSKTSILNRAQAEQVALAYFCGVNDTVISETFENISEGTIRKTAYNRTNDNLQSTLLNMYRSVSKEKMVNYRALNATHTFLANNGIFIPNADLVLTPESDPKNAAYLIHKTIFTPQIESLITDTNLNDFFTPTSGHERLVNAVMEFKSNGDKRAEIITLKKYLDNLLSEYKLDSVSLSDVYERTREDIIYGIREGGLTIHPKGLKAKKIESLLDELSDKEQEILSLRFGINCESKSRSEIADRMNCGQQNIHQIEMRAISRKLILNDRRYLVFKNLYEDLTPDKDFISPEIIQEKNLLEAIDEYKRTNNVDILANIPIDISTFSRRTINCLSNININTLNKLLERSEDYLLETPNMGRKSIKEIEDYLAKYGLKIGEAK